MQILVLTILAVMGFAANSVICRIALSQNYIDPVSFASLRLVFGAALLWILLKANQAPRHESKESFDIFSALALFTYAICFSLAYTQLDASSGAIILFGVVQLSLLAWAFVKGERVTRSMLFGLVISSGGLLYLLSPGLNAPPINGAIAMVVAGLAWSVYTILGKNAADPACRTKQNFLACVPLAIVVLLLTVETHKFTVPGVILAFASGAYASGVSYVFWYTVMPKLTFIQASSAQFMVPVFASLGGIVFLSEPLTPRFIVTSTLILLGIALVLVARRASIAGAGDAH